MIIHSYWGMIVLGFAAYGFGCWLYLGIKLVVEVIKDKVY